MAWHSDRVLVVYVAVGRLRPLQYDVRAALLVERDEAAVQLAARLLKHAHGDADARLAQLLYARPAHLGKRVLAPYDHSTHTFLYYKVGAGRRLAVVGARLKAHVERRLRQQRLVSRAHRGKGVNLGVGLAVLRVVSLAYYPASRGHYDRAHHGVGSRPVDAAGGQLQAAAHVQCVFLQLLIDFKYLAHIVYFVTFAP